MLLLLLLLHLRAAGLAQAVGVHPVAGGDRCLNLSSALPSLVNVSKLVLAKEKPEPEFWLTEKGDPGAGAPSWPQQPLVAPKSPAAAPPNVRRRSAPRLPLRCEHCWALVMVEAPTACAARLPGCRG